MAAVHITEVQVDAATDTLTITGQDFAASGALLVRLGGVIITTDCHVDSSTLITCVVTNGLPDPGDYRLTVAKGSGTGYHYDLTIGAVGPQGPPGPPGPAGPTPHFFTRECGQGTNPCDCPEGETIISGGGFCPTSTFLITSARNGNGWEAKCSNINFSIIVNASQTNILCCANCGLN
jgi:hypothetical protein